MNNPERAIQLNETERFALYIPDYPADLDEFIGDSLCVVGTNIRHQNIWGDDNKNRAKVFESLVARFSDRYDGNDIAERVFVKWLALQGVPAKRVTLTAYRDVETAVVWASYESEVSDDAWRAMLQGVQSWYSGDYATVTHENRVTYTAESGATIDRWENVTEDESVVTAFTDSFDLATVREYFAYTVTADI